MVQKSTAGRPRGFDEEVVLGRAIELFWHRGYAATAVPDLEAATGLNRSSLYNAFGSKEALFLVALERYLAALRGLMFDPLHQGQAGLADLDAFVDRLAQALRSPAGAEGCLIVATMGEEVGRSAPVARLTSAYVTEAVAAVGAALRRARARGETTLASRAVDAEAQGFVTQVVGLNTLARAGARGDELNALLDALRRRITALRR